MVRVLQIISINKKPSNHLILILEIMSLILFMFISLSLIFFINKAKPFKNLIDLTDLLKIDELIRFDHYSVKK